jgi:hypothetical protein
MEKKVCSCGSNLSFEDIYDARRIFVARVCNKCREQKLKKFRKEIFTDPNYWHDEPISDDHFDY